MENNKQIACRVSINTIIQNITLSLIKISAGIIGNSAAMISDAFHSLSDVLSTVVVIIGINISSKKADEKHPYGHEKLECITSVILAMLLFTTAVGIGINGVFAMINCFKGTHSVEPPGLIALIAATISVIVKESMYHYTVRAARKIKSTSMMADAWHHRSDAISSIGAFIGIGGAMAGFLFLDPLVSVIISALILKVAIDISVSAVNQMVDTAAPAEIIEKMEKIISKFPDVQKTDFIKTRLFGNKIYVDIELQLDKSFTLEKAHTIIENIHDEIESEIPDIKHCMIHANPAK